MSDNENKPQPRARPQSMIAQRFSLALDSAFGLDSPGTLDLAQSVEDKKLAVDTKAAELEALEVRLQATEARLRAATQAGGVSGVQADGLQDKSTAGQTAARRAEADKTEARRAESSEESG